eukprot:1009279-Amphidinium_carterae.1
MWRCNGANGSTRSDVGTVLWLVLTKREPHDLRGGEHQCGHGRSVITSWSQSSTVEGCYAWDV